MVLLKRGKPNFPKVVYNKNSMVLTYVYLHFSFGKLGFRQGLLNIYYDSEREFEFSQIRI